MALRHPRTPPYAVLRLERYDFERGALSSRVLTGLPPRARKDCPRASGVGIQRLKAPSNLQPTPPENASSHVLFPHRQPDARASASTRPLREFKRIYRDEELRGWLRDGRPTRLLRAGGRIVRPSGVHSCARAGGALASAVVSLGCPRLAPARLPAAYPQLTATSPAQLARVQLSQWRSHQRHGAPPAANRMIPPSKCSLNRPFSLNTGARPVRAPCTFDLRLYFRVRAI